MSAEPLLLRLKRALAKLYLKEPGSDTVLSLFRNAKGRERFVSSLAFAEVLSAITRKRIVAAIDSARRARFLRLNAVRPDGNGFDPVRTHIS